MLFFAYGGIGLALAIAVLLYEGMKVKELPVAVVLILVWPILVPVVIIEWLNEEYRFGDMVIFKGFKNREKIKLSKEK